MVINYLVEDYETGRQASDLTAYLNGLGTSGWVYDTVDLKNATSRRAIFSQHLLIAQLVLCSINLPPLRHRCAQIRRLATR